MPTEDDDDDDVVDVSSYFLCNSSLADLKHFDDQCKHIYLSVVWRPCVETFYSHLQFSLKLKINIETNVEIIKLLFCCANIISRLGPRWYACLLQ